MCSSREETCRDAVLYREWGIVAKLIGDLLHDRGELQHAARRRVDLLDPLELLVDLIVALQVLPVVVGVKNCRLHHLKLREIYGFLANELDVEEFTGERLVKSTLHAETGRLVHLLGARVGPDHVVEDRRVRTLAVAAEVVQERPSEVPEILTVEVLRLQQEAVVRRELWLAEGERQERELKRVIEGKLLSWRHERF